MKNQTPLSKYQWLVVAILALTQFTVVLDFMVMSPLGDLLMKDLQVKPYQFGIVVSSYALAAGLSGFLTAGFADRFDRKRLLVFFYSGFIIGTMFCGLAQSYEQLVMARIFTGIFGGKTRFEFRIYDNTIYLCFHREPEQAIVYTGKY